MNNDFISTLKKRFSYWSELGHVKPEFEPPEVTAGREGEDFLYSLVSSNMRYKGAHCFIGKRVPSNKHHCRFEIDLIVLTKKQIHILEVKNWSGRLRSEQDHWIQVKRDGTEVEHHHLTQHNAAKSAALLTYLNEQGIYLDREFASQKVLFMNHNLIIDKAISKDKNVIQRWQLNQYLRTYKGANISERLLHCVIEACLETEKSKHVLNERFDSLPTEAFDRAIQAIKALRTWDRVKLHGGLVLQGDAHEIWTREQSIDMSIFPTDSKIKFNWARGRILGFIKIVLLGLAPGNLKNKITPCHKLYPDYGKFNFHAVGDRATRQIDIKQVDWVTIG